MKTIKSQINQYSDVRGHNEITAQGLIDEARNELKSLTDHGDQMHRRAVVGRNITAHREGVSGQGQYYRGYIVGIRVVGQYTNRAEIMVETKTLADALVVEVNNILKNNPIGLEE